MIRLRSEPRWATLAKATAIVCALGLHLAVVAAILASPSDTEPPRINPPMQVSMVELVPDAAPQPDTAAPEAPPEQAAPAVQSPAEPVVEPEPAAEPEPVPDPDPEPLPEAVAEPEPPPPPEPPAPVVADAEPTPPPLAPVEHPVVPEPRKPEPKPQVHREPVQHKVVARKHVVRHKPSPKKAPAVEKPVPRLADARPSATPSSDAPPAPARPAPAAAPTQPRWVTRVAYQGNPPHPRYPAAAQRRGQTGKVVIRVVISADGSVVKAVIEKSSGHELLDDAALDAVRRARFKPYTENGVAYSAMADIPIDFVL